MKHYQIVKTGEIVSEEGLEFLLFGKFSCDGAGMIADRLEWGLIRELDKDQELKRDQAIASSELAAAAKVATEEKVAGAVDEIIEADDELDETAGTVGDFADKHPGSGN